MTADVTSRALRLLALLQSRTLWSGEELAEHLDVTIRSVRRDIDRLRALGYPVLASSGHGGGYRLGPGRTLPPLLLGPGEAVAVAVGLQLAAASPIDGLQDGAVRALSILDPVLPPAARAEARAIGDTLGVLTSRSGTVAGPVLLVLARAVRDGVQVRLDYRRADGERSSRRLEPYRVLAVDGRWYLFAWDLDREDWRTFRLDRILEARPSTFRFAPRETPDVDEHVRASITGARAPRPMTVRLRASAEEVAARIPASVGTVERGEPIRAPLADLSDRPDGAGAVTERAEGAEPAEGAETCVLRISGGDPAWTVMHLARLGHRVLAVDPPELATEIARQAAWFDDARAALAEPTPTSTSSVTLRPTRGPI